MASSCPTLRPTTVQRYAGVHTLSVGFPVVAPVQDAQPVARLCVYSLCGVRSRSGWPALSRRGVAAPMSRFAGTVVVVAGTLALIAPPARAGGALAASGDSTSAIAVSAPPDFEAAGPGFSSRHLVMPTATRELLAAIHRKVPAFSRQTGLACSACHYQFPQLTPFGRSFKLNGYSLVGLKPVVEPNAKKGSSLSLLPIPPIAVMLMASGSHLGEARPGAQNDNAEMPQQLSLFMAGALTPHLGALLQVTYEGASGTVGIDNSDIRYVTRTQIAAKSAVVGITLHNNPTVQDVWNTTPAWGYPFISSDATPGAAAGAIIDGTLAQQVLGLGAYGLWNNLLYVEATGYRTAQQGVSPPDSTATNVIHGVAPYWRAALQHQFGSTYGMVGTYGLATQLYPSGVTGLTDRHTDAAVDAQIEQPFGGGGVVIARATWINEEQRLAALFASGGADQLRHTLNTAQINATFEPSQAYGGTIGYFSTTGTRDTLLYAASPLVGSHTGKPLTDGFIEEFDVNPWQNIRIGIQGVEYSRFNGAATNYDGVGRPASGNNTVYVFTWVAF